MMSTANLTCCVNVVNSQYQQQSGGQYRDRQPPHQSRWQWGWLRRPRTWSVHNHADRETQRGRSQGHHFDLPNSRDTDKNSDFAYSDSDQDIKNPQNVSCKTQKVMVDLVPHLWLIKKKQKWKRQFVTQPGRTYFVKDPNVWFFFHFFFLLIMSSSKSFIDDERNSAPVVHNPWFHSLIQVRATENNHFC